MQIALTSGKARKVALRGKSDASPFIIEELYAAWAGPWAGWEESRLTTEDFGNAREWNELDLMECCDTFFFLTTSLYSLSCPIPCCPEDFSPWQVLGPAKEL